MIRLTFRTLLQTARLLRACRLDRPQRDIFLYGMVYGARNFTVNHRRPK